jgi:hypothetical protein
MESEEGAPADSVHMSLGTLVAFGSGWQQSATAMVVLVSKPPLTAMMIK